MTNRFKLSVCSLFLGNQMKVVHPFCSIYTVYCTFFFCELQSLFLYRTEVFSHQTSASTLVQL